MTCQTCEVPIVKTGLRGPNPKFCEVCTKLRKRDRVYRWVAQNRGRYNELGRLSYRNNLDVRRAKAREWVRNHPRPKSTRIVMSEAQRKESHRLSRKKWARNNLEKLAAIERLHQARKRGAEGRHTILEWRDLVSRYDGRCAYCDRGDIELTEDHVVPVSKGGRNDIQNIVPACRSCNARKGNRPVEFMQAMGGVEK